MEKDRDEFVSLKNNYKARLDKRIKDKLKRQEEEILASMDEISGEYDNSLLEFEEDLINQKKRYQIDYLQLLFDESKSLDKEYNELQQETFGNVENE